MSRLKVAAVSIRAKLAALRASRRLIEQPTPRYDEVFREGTKWLNELAVTPWKGLVEVDPSYWEVDYRE